MRVLVLVGKFNLILCVIFHYSAAAQSHFPMLYRDLIEKVIHHTTQLTNQALF